MNCPACKTTAMEELDLAPGLAARRCLGCRGHWVDGAAYFQWIEANPPRTAPWEERTLAGGDDPIEPPGDNLRAKLCPACGRFLTRAKVGRGMEFYLDHCGSCGGTWFDPGEWEALCGRELQGCVHFIFSDAWQADVSRHDREAQHDRLLAGKVGEADWSEIKRIRAWLDAHPHKAELYAALTRDHKGDRYPPS